MKEPNQDSIATYITALLLHYGFELGRYNAEELIRKWLGDFEVNWVRLAVVEALYLGRYKAVSVDQILNAWQRRGRPLYHFNHDFDRLICHEFSEKDEKKPKKSTIPPQDFASENLAAKNEHILALLTVPLGIEMSVKMESTLQYEKGNFSAQLPNIDKNEQSLGSSDHKDTERCLEEPNWLKVDASKYPIDQFTPSPDGSDFYLKLKALMGDGEARISE